jgi:hypothetical protein
MAGQKKDRTVTATPRFLRAKRDLPEEVQTETDSQVRALVDDPLAGEQKRGALRDVRVVKFKVGRQQYLLAYRFFPKSNVLDMVDVGVHENFYRDLEKYLKG